MIIFKKPIVTNNKKGFYVYKGLDKKTKELLYIGTTTQKPSDRFRWHKHNGKDLDFHIIKECYNETEMLDLEYSLIKEYKPKLNNIIHRKQNFNKVLSEEDIKLRVGNRALERGICRGLDTEPNYIAQPKDVNIYYYATYLHPIQSNNKDF